MIQIDDNTANDRLYEAYQQRIEDSGKTIAIDEHVADVIRTLALYANRSAACPIPLQKGVILYGRTGVGKTKMLEALRDLERFIHGTGWRVHYLPKITRAVDDEQSTVVLGELSATKRPLCLDDVGAEPQVKVFGMEKPVFQTIVGSWYEDQFSKKRQRLFLTSNIPFDYNGDAAACKWAQVYGPDSRLFSRLAEMCTPLPFLGTDKRLLR